MKLQGNGHPSERSTQKLRKYSLLFGLTSFLIANISFLIQGFFVRYRADDFCFSGILKEYGFLNGLISFYSTTSNRYSAYIFSAATELFGMKSIQFIAPLVIFLVGYTLFKLMRKILFQDLKVDSFLTPVLISQVLLFFILYLAPNSHQSVFWRSGLIHYFLPVSFFFCLMLSVVFHDYREKLEIWQSMCIFLTSFFAAGLSESYAALQATALALFIIWFLVKKQSKRIISPLVSFIGTILAMSVMVLAPGNTLRLETLQQAPDLLTIFSIAAESAVDFIYFSIRGLWLPFGILFGFMVLSSFGYFPAFFSDGNNKSLTSALLIVPIVTFILIVSICAPTAYGMMAYPEKRVLMLAHTMLVLGISIESVFIGQLLKRYFIPNPVLNIIIPLTLMIICGYPLATLKTRISTVEHYAARAGKWELQYNEIAEQVKTGKTDLVVGALDSYAEITEMSSNMRFWVNQCVAQYYGVHSIVVVEK